MENRVEERISHLTDIWVQEEKQQIKEPSMYQVVMHNDDYTPMEFVVTALKLFFNMESARATSLMYQVHMTGKAVCGIFTKDIAETKADQVIDYARRHEHPLLCSIEAT
ncbi:MAG: ATP-dependent Clp protease adapter ClpS [Gammaproteobacteria bacterium]|nr:ATP-dependent Clp protease adapter ClpS [Gammaproteobacteria bacterium]